MRRQARSFGAEFLLAEAEALELEGDIKKVKTSRGTFRAFGVLLAAGARPRSAGFKGEAEFRGRGVAYCATCDGEFFTGLDILVVGGGFAAAEEGLFLTRYARHVTILIRGADFSCAKAAAEAVRNHEKVTVLVNTELEEVAGEGSLNYARWRDKLTGETTEYRPPAGKTFGVFVFAGLEPAVELVRDLPVLDGRGYVAVDRNQKTALEGLYAAGDICAKSLRQVVTAVSDGASAATELEKYARTMQEKTGLHPAPSVSRLPAAAPAARHTEPSVAQSAEGESATDGFFTPEIKTQLRGLFEKMARPLTLRLSLDDRPVSEELRHFAEELAGMTDKLTVETLPPPAASHPPCVRLCLPDGTDTGLAFHGVPGGHEFNSFVIGLYNAAGPGQALDPEAVETLASIRHPVSLKILVSLSCTMCPDLVMAAQRLAAASPFISAESYDINHFPDLREKYQVMSVPCMVINDDTVSFGKKNIRELLGLIAP
jgi:thioredoxin reductase (NADPH)